MAVSSAADALRQTSHALHDLLLIATVYASMNHSSTKQIVVDVLQNSF